MRRAGKRAAALAALVGAALTLLLAAPAGAHPLGNFTINHLTQVRISADRVDLRYILDQAEIPSFQESQRFDSDASGAIEGSERGPLLRRKLAEIVPALELYADGRRLHIGEPATVSLGFPEGQAGLPLTRLVASFSVPLGETTMEGIPSAGAPPQRIEFHDGTYPGRVGWKAVQIRPGEGADVRSSVPASDPTNGLRAYPVDLLQSPPDVRDAGFEVSPGDGGLIAPGAPDVGPVTTDRAQDGFAGALAGGNTHGLLILLLLAAAAGWGALHALSPGHGKSMVAGYLVGSRGTPRHAAILGLTVTVTHTFAVFALGLITLLASEYILPEDLYPWLGVASGLSVIAVGLYVMRARFRRWQALRSGSGGAAAGDGHSHDGHGAGSGHAHSHSHGHKPDSGHSHSHSHSHSHDPPDGPISMRTLIALGVSGGAVPCPSALVVLIAAISQHRVGLGMLLIAAFSIGLAATLTGVGLAVLYGGRLVERVRPESRLFAGRWTGMAPALSATIIVFAGTLITLRAIPQIG